MKFYAYIRNMLYAQYCIDRENTGEEYDEDIFTRDYLKTIGTTCIVTDLQEQYNNYDVYYSYVEIKEGWCVKLLSSN